MIRLACCIVAIAAVLPVAAADRASQGTLLKSAPPKVPPAVSTSAIRLFGFTGKKDAAELPAHVATASLHLWGGTSSGDVVPTARLLLLGPVELPAAIHTTEPIRLWGGS